MAGPVSPSQMAIRTFVALAALFVVVWGALWLWRALDDDWCNRFRTPAREGPPPPDAPPMIDDHGGIVCKSIHP